MRRLLFAGIMVLATAVAVATTSCNNSNKQEDKKMKALIAYFSATGTTKAVAEQIAKATGGTLYEIEPEVSYTTADLDWEDEQSRSTVEMKDKKSRPAIKGMVDNIEQYEIIYIGFPIWWYQHPTIINTFIEKNNLKGKKVKTFATSDGTDITQADALLKADYPEINWVKGKLLNRPSEKEIQNFIE